MLELPYCPEAEKSFRCKEFVSTEHLSPKISNTMRKSLKKSEKYCLKAIITLTDTAKVVELVLAGEH